MHTIIDTMTAEEAPAKRPPARPDTRWRDSLRGTLFQRYLPEA